MAVSSLTVMADGLTSLRLGIAIAVIPVAWSQDLTTTSVLVSLAWLTDLFDGRLARAGGRAGRLHRWDLRADTAVGAGVLVGLVGGELAPWWLLIAGALFAWGYWRGNVAAAMLLQLCGFVPLLILLWSLRPPGWWMPLVTALVIAVVDWRKLVMVNIPAFIGGLKRP